MKSTLVALLTALLVTLTVFSVPPVAAGTAAAPEVTDNPNDQAVDGVPLCPRPPEACVFGSMDILTAWVDNETATDFQVHIVVSVEPASAVQYRNTWLFNMKFNATDFVAGADWLGSPVPPGAPPTAAAAPVPTGVATNVSVTGTQFTLTIPKGALGQVTAGSSLTDLFVTAERTDFATESVLATDRAPDGAGFGTAYTFTTGGTTQGPDSDNDGLNDTFEQEHFGDLNETGAGDMDNDGLTNAQEQALGTDPTKADTDGDGAGDKTEVDAGTSPTDPTSKPNDTNPPPPPPPGPNPPPPPGPNPPPPPPPGNGGGDGDGEDSFMDKLTANPSYLGIAAGGAIVLLIVALIGIFGRWGA